jgi:hypothetical protein
MTNISILHRFKPLLVVLGWATSLASLTLGIIFQGLLLPNASELLPESYGASSLWLWVFYLGSFGICLLAAMLISDFGQSVVSVFFAYGLTALIVFVVLALPDFLGIFQPSGLLQEPAVSFTFNALFPFPLFVDFIGAIAGSALGERLL